MGASLSDALRPPGTPASAQIAENPAPIATASSKEKTQKEKPKQTSKETLKKTSKETSRETSKEKLKETPSSTPDLKTKTQSKKNVSEGGLSENESLQSMPNMDTPDNSMVLGPSLPSAESAESAEKTPSPKGAVSSPSKPQFVIPADNKTKVNPFDKNYDTILMMPEVDWKKTDKKPKTPQK
ncbi:unnamed protein product [Caenorhabditis auriculariae]|uniref:Uncharacterized protein n=1 Tax=Caenorhabditis auriculariae TaxID=2777116 RepID=A0A8S1HMX5_9PELO|nr:unnamed protein product [Caenorhabditis auriculariae]